MSNEKYDNMIISEIKTNGPQHPRQLILTLSNQNKLLNSIQKNAAKTRILVLIKKGFLSYENDYKLKIKTKTT